MIVVYADGGGLGHLTRVQALRHTLGLTGEIVVLTSSHHVEDPRVAEGLRVVPIRIRRDDLAARRSWLQRTLVDLTPSRLIVDAFPAGLAGEIDVDTVPSSIEVVHVARLLRWPVYRRILPDAAVRPARTYLLEPLHADHLDHLVGHTDHLEHLDLLDPPTTVTDPAPWEPVEAELDRRGAPVGRPRWLVAHTGPAAEVADLVAYARDQAAAEGVSPVLVVATAPDAAPAPAPDLVVVDRYPVWPLFAGADRVVTAAGFNTMRQLAGHRARHRFVAMPRRFDDQFERARRARRDAGAVVGPEPEPAPEPARARP